MISKTTTDFGPPSMPFPAEMQSQAREKFTLWRRDPRHPSLHFKELRPGLWSVRINFQYRALGWRQGEQLLWFWIGAHGEYDRRI